ncbi:hypothetical protein Ctha_2079 [Chloroherpeton thalassium ATCC 35110]|uniref:Uncharacterized protein n=1 Tax=Chloroherpeton thalassium (strain ATCC 35110 / GB-78) TaxID=517418 RepID=B3QVD1_CHLT3|nr:hypothetical protein [Chloroherpeton thalassium]ACF14531.1 hypothetical protein Ctha_2079 [Chloroherpeton thalassium ATCC 35110]
MSFQTLTTRRYNMNTAFELWAIDNELIPDNLTESIIYKLREATDRNEKKKWTYMLSLLFVSGESREEGLETKAKAEILKQGEFNLISSDQQKLLSEVAKSMKVLDAMPGIENSAPRPKDEITDINFEPVRITAYLLKVPMVLSTMQRILETIQKFTFTKNIPIEPSYILLNWVYEKFENPAYKGITMRLDDEFWEYFAGMSFKVMSKFLYEATMEYILYYELPPGGHNDIHLKRCEKLLDITIECNAMLKWVLPKIKYQLDYHIYSFCLDVIDNNNPHPLINFSYRLLDFSSEDFYITLPKDIINKYIKNSLVRLRALK